jgi:hypothetical protein
VSAAIPAEILDVAAVVLGEQRTSLSGWQKHDAICAMAALGYSKTHIAWALCTSRATIENFGYLNGITLHRYDQRPDWEAIRWVTHHGARMRLENPDRVHAIRGLAAQGHHLQEIARRLLCSDRCVTDVARRHRIALPDAPPAAGGWRVYSRGSGRPKAVAA